MKFGKSRDEAQSEPGRGGGGSFMKYLGDGDTLIHVVDEPDKWVWYWEHYNPGGNPFPCTNDRDSCPGCTSDDEKVSKASRKIAFNAVSEYNGKPYVNVWKVPKTVVDKLETRYERNGTITDRPYLITRFKKDNGFYDYDVEGQSKEEPEFDKEHLADPEEFLAQAYEEAWGDSTKAKATKATSKQASREADLGSKIAKIKRDEKPEEPEEIEMNEADLRKMEPWDLAALCEKHGFGTPPKADNSDQIVDWMLEKA